jgi:CBS domain-containing protein
MAARPSLVEILKSVKVADLPGVEEVITVTSDDSVQEGFQKLADHQILSAPVWDLKNQVYTGFVDVRDLVSWVVFIDDDENAEIPSELSPLIGHGARYFKLPIAATTARRASPRDGDTTKKEKRGRPREGENGSLWQQRRGADGELFTRDTFIEVH